MAVGILFLVELTREIGGGGIDLAFSGRRAEKFRASRAKTREHKTIGKRTEPAFIEPMQCKPVTALPAGEKWTFEIKFDGYRCIAVKCGSAVTLFSRNEKVLNERFPKVVDARASLAREAFLSAFAEQPVARASGLLLRLS